MYLLPTEGFSASEFYRKFEAAKKGLNVADWGLSQSSLEDVFTKIYTNDAGNLA